MNRLRFFAALVLLGVLALETEAQENDTSGDVIEKVFTIDNCVSSLDMDDVIKTKAGYQFWFVDKGFIDGRTLKMSVVAPGSATHPPHSHEVDEFFFILEGTARFHLDGKTTTAGAYTSFYCPSNVPHGISNAGDTELKYLVIKKYDQQ